MGVWVCRQPGTEAALYDLSSLSRLEWRLVSGGRGDVMADYFVSAVVPCDAAREGEVGHSGSHGPCPHEIRVVVVASHNEKSVMEALRKQVGPKPRRVTNAQRALATITAAGPEGICQSRLFEALGWHGPVSGRRMDSLSRLAAKGQVTITGETRADIVAGWSGRRSTELP